MSDGIFEINGEHYMTTRVASKLWGVKPKTVGEYCKDSKVVGAFKNERKKCASDCWPWGNCYLSCNK